MRLKPAGGYLLVQPLQEIPPVFAAVILRNAADSPPSIVSVVDTSDVLSDTSDTYVKGDKLLINPQKGTPVTVNGEKCLVISCRDVLALFEY